MAQENKDEVEEQAEEQEESSEETAEERQPMELPPVNFENFIFGLYNTAFIHLGIRDPETGELIQSLMLARHTIDTLGMIQDKTKGNLTAPESNMLENLLYNLRMGYLRAVKPPDEPAEDESAKEPETEDEPTESNDAESEAQDSKSESENTE